MYGFLSVKLFHVFRKFIKGLSKTDGGFLWEDAGSESTGLYQVCRHSHVVHLSSAKKKVFFIHVENSSNIQKIEYYALCFVNWMLVSFIEFYNFSVICLNTKKNSSLSL